MHSPLARLGACGLALTLTALLSLGAPARAQEKPPEDPKATGQKEREAKALEEIMKKVRAEAEKAGVRTDGPLGSTQPQPGAPAQPAPGAPPAKPAQPAIAPQNPSGSGRPPAKPAAPGIVQPARPAQPAGNTIRPPAGAPGAAPPATPAGAAPTQTVAHQSGGVRGENMDIDFVEPVDYPVLVDWFRRNLGLQIVMADGGLNNQKFFLSSPITIKTKDAIPFLTMLLEQKEYTLVQDFGVYYVRPKNSLEPNFGGNLSTTRIIHTPNIKPSSLQTSVQALLTAGRGGQGGTQPVFLDDLGVIMMTDSPRITALIEEFVDRIVAERAALKFFRFDLVNISAASARDRVLELLGQQAQRISTGTGPGGVAVAAPPGGAGQTITNLSDRMTIDPTSNALYLRGREDEQALLRDMLAVIDSPNAMVSKWYPVGNKTSQAVAAAGKAEQLGSVTEFDFSDSTGGGRGALGGGVGRGGSAGQNDSGGGAGFVLYPEAGGFIFRGTEPQHDRVRALVESLKIISADEVQTIEFYKLHHGKSTDVADTIQNLLSNSAGAGNRGGGLLGRDLGGRNRTRTPQAAGAARANGAPADGAGGPGGGLADLEGADVFVLADEPNNQILVKAPAKLQPQFRALISKIDLRRPQVYIDAKIVVVSQTDSVRLAIEAQQIIGQFAFNTNFGLGSLGTTTGGTSSGTLFDRKSPLTNLAGITSALVRSKDVPFIINALANNIDTRIVATPQLLVDDNEEAEISSLDQQPTSSTSQTAGNSQITGFQSYESAGPKFKVKPQISEGGYMRLEYTIELSSFSGTAASGLPPPKSENKISSKAVTVPTDTTIIVGGLTFTQTGRTVIKVPLLGDIPLAGNLFKDQSKANRLSTLYVFITPKIMRDPTFGDLRLLTRGPLAESGLAAEYPAPMPEAIPVVDTMRYEQERKLREEIDKHRPPTPKSPEKGTPVRRETPKSDEPQ
ncbi:MAG TPA: secretin N-terminal domain-containing protein [Phycisphaerales bacterium]|nr:secretin N-terminal domain-containing protein [Phycisphaerales bacterium]